MSIKRATSIVLVASAVMLAAGAVPGSAARSQPSDLGSPSAAAQGLGAEIPVSSSPESGSGLTAAGGGPIGREFVINSLAYNQVTPAVAYNSQRQEYLVVWTNEWSANRDIYGQRVSRHGQLLGGGNKWFAISPAGGDRFNPDVAYNSQHDEYLVVWEDGLDIQGQRVSATGVLQGGVITLAAGYLGLDSCSQPAVAYAHTADRYLLVWKYSGPVGRSLLARAFNSDGSPDGAAFAIVPWAAGSYDVGYPDLAYNRARNEFLVVFVSQELQTPDDDIWGRRVKMAGGADTLGGSFPIIYPYEPDQRPAVAAIPKPAGVGQYLVVAEHTLGPGGHIYGQRVTGLGVKEGPQIDVSVHIPAVGTSAVVAGNEGTEQYLVAWTHAGSAIRGRIVLMDGVLLGGETVIGENAPDRAAVADGPLGDFLVAFEAVGNSRDIHGRLWGNRVYLPFTLRND